METTRDRGVSQNRDSRETYLHASGLQGDDAVLC